MYKNSLFLGYILFIGTAQTLSPIASVYYHEGDYDRVRFVLMRSLRIVVLGGALLAALFALCPGILFALCPGDPVRTVFHRGRGEDGLHDLGHPAVRDQLSLRGLNFLISFYWQAIKRQTLSAALTALKGLALPLALVWLLSRRLGIRGVLPKS